jgi:hypothetical protein
MQLKILGMRALKMARIIFRNKMSKYTKNIINLITSKLEKYLTLMDFLTMKTTVD